MSDVLVDLLAEHADRSFQAEMLSDFLQATEAIVWDRRSGGSIAQLRSRGIELEELPMRLAQLACDAHHHLTNEERVVVLLTEEQVMTLLASRGAPLANPLRDTLLDAMRRLRP